MQCVKLIALSALTSSIVSRFFQPLIRGCSIVFMLHRFEDQEHGVLGHPDKALRAQLEMLRREGYLILPLTELLEGLHHGALRNRSAIAFTVDDGYGDFARVGARVFAAFDCPVTVFLVTAFLDGAEWLWWDRVEAAISSSDRTSMHVQIGDQSLTYQLESVAHRQRASGDITERLKRVSNAARLSIIEQIVSECCGSLPAAPPPKYAPMSWDEVRALSTGGVSFGPHSVTHPILPMVSDEQAAFELEASWQRVAEGAPSAIPIFSYPNGDYSSREQAILARMGLAAAVSDQHRYLRARDLESAHSRYALPRFCHWADKPHFVQIVSGLERAKENLRQSFRGAAASSIGVE